MFILRIIQTGEAVVTQGFKLPAKYTIHMAGSIWRSGHQNEEAMLRACYVISLDCANREFTGTGGLCVVSQPQV